MVIQNRGFEVEPLSTMQIKDVAKAVRLIAKNNDFVDKVGELDIVGLFRAWGL